MKIRFFGLTKSEKAAFLLDYLVIYLFTAGVMWAVYQLTGLPVSIGENLLLSLVAVFLGLFILRFGGSSDSPCINSGRNFRIRGISRNGGIAEAFRNIGEGFSIGFQMGFRKEFHIRKNGSFYLIEIVLAVAVMLILTLLIRKLFYFPALCVIWVAIPAAFFALGNRNVTFLVCMMIACCVVSMPRFAYNCALKKSDESAFRISRSSMQILAVPIALICILLAVFMTPENDGAWKNKFLVRRLDDIQTLIDVWRGDLGVHPVFKIADFARICLMEIKSEGTLKPGRKKS